MKKLTPVAALALAALLVGVAWGMPSQTLQVGNLTAAERDRLKIGLPYLERREQTEYMIGRAQAEITRLQGELATQNALILPQLDEIFTARYGVDPDLTDFSLVRNNKGAVVGITLVQ